jgi:metal-dependent hydrolase (beta-lactamase superfamily II)
MTNHAILFDTGLEVSAYTNLNFIKNLLGTQKLNSIIISHYHFDHIGGLNRLKELNCQIYEIGNTGLIAYFDYEKEKTIAFRAELDGLNIKEETDLEYKSIHDEVMHACGHDGHMSILLGLCDYLSDKETYETIFFIYPKTDEFRKGTIVFSDEIKVSSYWQRDIYNISIKNDKLRNLFMNFKENKIFYSSDLCGTDFKQVIDFTIRR